MGGKTTFSAETATSIPRKMPRKKKLNPGPKKWSKEKKKKTTTTWNPSRPIDRQHLGAILLVVSKFTTSQNHVEKIKSTFKKGGSGESKAGGGWRQNSIHNPTIQQKKKLGLHRSRIFREFPEAVIMKTVTFTMDRG